MVRVQSSPTPIPAPPMLPLSTLFPSSVRFSFAPLINSIAAVVAYHALRSMFTSRIVRLTVVPSITILFRAIFPSSSENLPVRTALLYLDTLPALIVKSRRWALSAVSGSLSSSSTAACVCMVCAAFTLSMPGVPKEAPARKPASRNAAAHLPTLRRPSTLRFLSFPFCFSIFCCFPRCCFTV